MNWLERKLAEPRRRMRKAMPKVSLEHAHTEHGVLLPNRLAMLDLMPKGGQVAEIGVATGQFSSEILERCAPDCLHLVDAWSQSRYSPARVKVEERFAREISQGAVELHVGMSTDKLKEFADDSLDWAYIDTNHTYKTTKAELEICARIVKPGGLIAGHDFCTGNVVKPVVYGVIQAVNEFCVKHAWRYKYVTLESGGHFSFCLERI